MVKLPFSNDELKPISELSSTICYYFKPDIVHQNKDIELLNKNKRKYEEFSEPLLNLEKQKLEIEIKHKTDLLELFRGEKEQNNNILIKKFKEKYERAFEKYKQELENDIEREFKSKDKEIEALYKEINNIDEEMKTREKLLVLSNQTQDMESPMESVRSEISDDNMSVNNDETVSATPDIKASNSNDGRELKRF